MSLTLHDAIYINQSPPEDAAEEQQALALLNRYLNVIEDNKKSCAFVPNDALLALDMAGFARGLMKTNGTKMRISTARLAMALVQPGDRPPTQ